MDAFRQPARSRSLSGAENILRMGRGEQPVANPALREGELSRKGQAALDLVSQVADTINPKKPQYNALSALAKTILKGSNLEPISCPQFYRPGPPNALKP